MKGRSACAGASRLLLRAAAEFGNKTAFVPLESFPWLLRVSRPHGIKFLEGLMTRD